MMEGMLPEYGVFGSVRQPTGSRIPTAAPSSAYPCSDGKWVLVAANSEPLFAKLAELMGQPDLPRDPRFVNNPSRVKNVEELDRIIGTWTKGLTAEEADRRLTEADIPCTLIYTAAEIAADPQFRERGMVRDVEDPQFGTVLHPGVVPHVPDDPGVIRWPGPPIGAHNDEIMGEVLGMKPAEIEALLQEGVL
jgi:crotonobetainyl-CoA:carnitine CoA-transferase CaiB-like acyl-CoA transferase